MKNHLDLSGKVALITGASSGIGAASAMVFADLGAHVTIGYYQNQAGAETVREAITTAGGKALSIKADIRQADEIEILVRCTYEELGPIDILVNNAGSLVEWQSSNQMTEER